MRIGIGSIHTIQCGRVWQLVHVVLEEDIAMTRTMRLFSKAALASLLVLAFGIHFVACSDSPGTASFGEDIPTTADVTQTDDAATETTLDTGPDLEIDVPSTPPFVAECEEDFDCVGTVPTGSPACVRAECGPDFKCHVFADNDWCDLNDEDPCYLSQCDPDRMVNDGCIKLTVKGPIACDDDVDCTLDLCEPGIGCRYETENEFCDDSNVCTEDYCNTLEGCMHNPVNVDDGDQSTIDGCTPDGGVYHTPKVDEDCEIAEQCGPTGNLCSTFFCEQGSCMEYQIGVEMCNDGNSCTVDSCDPIEGCSNIQLDCNDDDPCTADSCSNGACESTPLNCNDGDPCTEDVCTPGVGCQSAPVDCNDGDPCTVDYCKGFGECVHEDDTCDDGNPATIDMCTPGVGCVYSSNPNWCTIDSDCGQVIDLCSPWKCDNNTCVQKPLDCDDDVECTIDFCDTYGNCQVWENHDACGEGLFCNAWFDYEPGTSQSGCIDSCNKDEHCDDGNPCTEDWCGGYYGAGKECQNEIQYSDGTECESSSGIEGYCSEGTCVQCYFDGWACTGDFGEGTCFDGACVECQGSWQCDDGNPCTKDICAPLESGDEGSGAGGPSPIDEPGFCTHEAITGTPGFEDEVCEEGEECSEYTNSFNCDDSECTTGDMCDAGVCIPGSTECGNNDPCKVGTCVSDEWGDWCSYDDMPFGTSCTTDEGLNGTCTNWGDCYVECTEHLDCDDSKPCTEDACDKLTGTCVHKTNHAKWDCIPCYDDFECVGASVCKGGTEHWRFNTSGLCLEGSCELDSTPIACPDCEQFTWADGGVAKVGLCEEQLLCPGGGPCGVEDIDFTQDCLSCQDDLEQTFAVCFEDGTCGQYESTYCAFSGEVWFEDDGCRGCFENLDCEDGNPCTGQGSCSSYGYCQGMGESPDDWTECDDLPKCGGFDDPSCELGNCIGNRCIAPKPCSSDFDCPGYQRKFCLEGYCQPCLPAIDAHEGGDKHIGCWSSTPLCEPAGQEDPVTADEIIIFTCLPSLE
jgi:hypothetical protein